MTQIDTRPFDTGAATAHRQPVELRRRAWRLVQALWQRVQPEDGLDRLDARLWRDAGLDEQERPWDAARKAPLIRG